MSYNEKIQMFVSEELLNSVGPVFPDDDNHATELFRDSAQPGLIGDECAKLL